MCEKDFETAHDVIYGKRELYNFREDGDVLLDRRIPRMLIDSCLIHNTLEA